jgi:hypothetical protein
MKKLFSVFAIMLLTAAAFAQPNAASVTGVVTDTSGAVVIGADVTLVNTNTSNVYHGKTNSQGSYTIPNVPPGPGYKLTIVDAGFAPIEYTGIYMTVANTRTQNARLTPSAVSTTVEVSAANQEVTLDTTDATIGNNFDVKLLNELPVQVRDNPAALFTLQPGVAATSVTGARTDQTDVTLDGLDVNDISTGQAFLIVSNAPVDSVQEFRGTVAGQLSNSGPGSGGQFQLVTKSGTNQWHGNVNEYHRDTATVANFWFNDNTGVHLPHYVRNQFGGNVGGPIKKDKAFFFFNFYDSRRATSASQLATVPLDSYRNGNIQYILAQASNGSGACGATTRANTTPQCVGTITSAQIAALDPQHVGFSSTIQGFLNSRYPHANDLTAGDGLNTGGYRFNAPEPDNETNYVARVDFTLTPTMKIFAKAGINRRDAVQTPQFLPADPVLGNPFQDRSYNYVVGHTWQIGANKVNEFYYGDTVEKYNFPGNYAPTGTTVLTFGGGTPTFLGSPYNEQQTQKRRIPVPVVRDDFNWTKGTHSLGFGGSFKFIKTESQQILDFNFVNLGLGGNLLGLDSTVRPANIRTAGTTGTSRYDNAFAFALGRVASVDTNYNYTSTGTALPNGTGHVRRYRYYETELYANDTWKISRNLTLTYGLGYQLYSVPYEVNGAESIQNYTFDQYFAARVKQSTAGTSGDTTVPFITYNLGGKANHAAPLYQPSYKDFSPRVAFAYNPSFSPKLVINGGAGIVYDRTVINALNFIQDQSSFLFQNQATTQYGSTSASASLLKDPRVGANFAFQNPNVAPKITRPYTPFVDSNGTPFGLGANTFNTIIDPTLKDPYAITMNVGVQQQMPGNLVFKLSYVGRLGRRLLGQADASQLIDFPDKASGQGLATAFGNLTQELRAGQAKATAQPWFENQIGKGFTQVLYASSLGGLIQNGDFADFVQALAANGLIDSNIGMASQFSENTYYTNKGFSSYNGLLFTLDKNMSHGLQFQFNYTWSHSIDNTSLIANAIAASGIGFICDVTRPRECRGNSDFDETTVVNGDFTYQLPFGRKRTFVSTTPRWADEFIGGWDISGIPTWHSGQAFSTVSNAFVAGYSENAPAIFNGNRQAVQAHVHKTSSGSVNMFSDQTAALNAFTGPVGLQIGSRNNLRGPSAWGMDAGVAKTFPLSAERVNLKFRADAFNVFNHPTFALPNNDITSASFGQITSTTGAPRVVQLALRLEF